MADLTLAPLVREDIRGVEGAPIKLEPGSKCVAPGCLSLAQEKHHIWSKSFLRGQPYEWVRIGERTIPNTCGLCHRHHAWVTGILSVGHMAKIVWDDAAGMLEWWEKDMSPGREEVWQFIGLLRGQALVDPEPEARRVRREEGLCPTCGRIQPRETKPGPRRKIKTWVVGVPDDHEDGADVLDVYVEDLAVLMGLDIRSARLLRYHVLVPVLEWVNQSKTAFIAEWEEAQT